MIDIAIYDDEPAIAQQIESLVCSVMCQADIAFSTKTFSSRENLCAALKIGDFFHILYLDISMDGISGVEVGNRLRSHFQNSNTILIYVSSYDQRAKEVFRLHAFRFLANIFSSLHLFSYINVQLRSAILPNEAITATD